MQISYNLKNVLCQCKASSEIDINTDLNSVKDLITDNLEDPFNSRVYLSTDITVSHIVSVFKRNNFYVEDRKIKGRTYPVIYTPDNKTSFMIFKTATIDIPNQFICELSGAINGLNGEKNTLGQLNLLNVEIDRNQDFKDNNAIHKYLGHYKKELQQFLILNYSTAFGVTKMFVNEYNGAGKLIDQMEVKNPIDPFDNFLDSSDKKNPSQNPNSSDNRIYLKLKFRNKKDKGI